MDKSFYYCEPYEHIEAKDIDDCVYQTHRSDDKLGCRFAEDGLICDSFNNPDEACHYRQMLYYKKKLKEEQFQHSGTKGLLTCSNKTMLNALDEYGRIKEKLDRARNMLMDIIQMTPEYDNCYYKDECGETCTPRTEGKITNCMYEAISSVLDVL